VVMIAQHCVRENMPVFSFMPRSWITPPTKVGGVFVKVARRA
jgi:hypothetical protein